jgi:hypothetical protein
MATMNSIVPKKLKGIGVNPIEIKRLIKDVVDILLYFLAVIMYVFKWLWTNKT